MSSSSGAPQDLGRAGGSGGHRVRRSVLRDMRLEELTWAAGLYEGEATLTREKPFTDAQGSRQYRYYRMNLVMTDHDAVKRFRDIIGCGRVVDRPAGPAMLRRSPRLKRQHRLALSEPVTAALVARMYPYLGDRRAADIRTMVESRVSQTLDAAGQPFPKPTLAEGPVPAGAMRGRLLVEAGSTYMDVEQLIRGLNDIRSWRVVIGQAARVTPATRPGQFPAIADPAPPMAPPSATEGRMWQPDLGLV